MKLKISKTAIDRELKKALSSSKRLFIYDTSLTGFGCRLTEKGVASYFVEYRHNGRKRRKTIGRHGPFTPDQARKAAKSLLGKVAAGTDIAEQSVKDKTFGEVIEAYLTQKSKPTKYWKDTNRFIYNNTNTLLTRHINSITRAELARLIDNITKRSHSVGRNTFSAIRPIFKWAFERGYIEINPIEGLSPPSVIPARERILDNDELKAIWHAAEKEPFPFNVIVKLLILTGQRRSEVTGMRWSEIEGEIWTIPGSTKNAGNRITKNRKEHFVHLHPLVLELLEDVPQTHDLIFTTTGTTAPSGLSKVKRRLDENSGVTNWRYHDLRRTCATGMASLGVLPNVIEYVLNHRSGVNSGLVGVYQKFEYREERRGAIMAWGDCVQTFMKTKSGFRNTRNK